MARKYKQRLIDIGFEGTINKLKEDYENNGDGSISFVKITEIINKKFNTDLDVGWIDGKLKLKEVRKRK